MSAVNIISGLSCTIPLATGIVVFRRTSKEMRILTIFFMVVFIVEIAGFYLTLNHFDNNWLVHVYTLLEYSFLLLLFSCWQKNSRFKRSFRLSIPLFAMIWLGSKLLFEDFDELDNYTASLESILLVGVSSFTLYNLCKENEMPLYKEPRFWIGGAVLIYFTGNLMTFALSNLIVALSFHWPLHSILNTICNLCFAGGFLCKYPRLNYGGRLSSVL